MFVLNLQYAIVNVSKKGKGKDSRLFDSIPTDQRPRARDL